MAICGLFQDTALMQTWMQPHTASESVPDQIQQGMAEGILCCC